MIRLGIAGWIGIIVVNLFLWAPLAVIGMLAFSDANSLTFPPPAYSTRWLTLLMTDTGWRTAIATSGKLASSVTVLSVVIGVPLALGLAKGRIGRSRAVQGLVAAPIILPAVSLAIGFYFVFAWLGLIDTIIPLVVAHTSVGIAFVVVTVTAAYKGLDPAFEPAARTLGASLFHATWSVTLPLIFVGIIGGAVLAFLNSWDDVINPLMLGTARVQPFPLKLWGEMQNVLNPIAATAAFLLSAFSITVLAVVTAIVAARRSRMPKNQAASVIFRQGRGA